MAFQTQVISVTASATGLFVFGSGATGSGTFKNVTGSQSDPLAGMLQNIDATNTLIVGGSDVATTGGIHLAPGQALPYQFVGIEAVTLFGSCSTATIQVAVMLSNQ